MEKENHKQKKSQASSGEKSRSGKKKSSARAAADQAASATERVDPHSRTGLGRDLRDTGTNVSYEENE
jgi:hypothetical protein